MIFRNNTKYTPQTGLIVYIASYICQAIFVYLKGHSFEEQVKISSKIFQKISSDKVKVDDVGSKFFFVHC